MIKADGPGGQIESHSSWLNNKRIITLQYQIDQYYNLASDTLSFQFVNAFYNRVENLYVNVKDVLRSEFKDEIIAASDNYNKLKGMIDLDSRYRNKKVLNKMLQHAKIMYDQIISGLQYKRFYFRMLNTSNKGLKHMNIFDELEEKEDGSEDENVTDESSSGS